VSKRICVSRFKWKYVDFGRFIYYKMVHNFWPWKQKSWIGWGYL